MGGEHEYELLLIVRQHRDASLGVRPAKLPATNGNKLPSCCMSDQAASYDMALHCEPNHMPRGISNGSCKRWVQPLGNRAVSSRLLAAGCRSNVAQVPTRFERALCSLDLLVACYKNQVKIDTVTLGMIRL